MPQNACRGLALILLVAVFLPTPCPAASPAGVPVYKVTPIGGITGLRINQAGDVVGWATRNGLAVPMLRTPENGVIVLPTSSSQPYGVARDVSERAAGVITVVGEARLDSSGSAIHAARWRIAMPQGIVTAVTDLGVLQGGSESQAYAINDAEKIVGTSDSGSSLSIRSFIHSPANGMRDLGLGSTGTSARALDVNDSGLIAGYLGLQAFRWSSTSRLDLLGRPDGWANSFAFAINDSGQVAGSASNGTGNAEVVARYTDGPGWKVLGGTGQRNVGNGINQWGDVVGIGLLSTLRQGVIYTDNLGLLAMIDDLLFTPGSWRVMEAYDINDAQQITGWAINTQTGSRSAVLLTPVNPAPPNEAPIAKFTYSCTASLFCSFDGSGSTDDRGILAWVWTAAGQKISVLQSKFIGVQFTTPQTINLTLTVTDTRGVTNSVTKPVVIGETNQPPVARFTVSCTRKACVLDASSSTDDHGIVTYRWRPSVSNRATLTGVIITRNRIGTGTNTYQETLTVIDGAGLKNSQTKIISFRN
jgi:probable HAF family extracellular repeat protein